MSTSTFIPLDLKGNAIKDIGIPVFEVSSVMSMILLSYPGGEDARSMSDARLSASPEADASPLTRTSPKASIRRPASSTG